MGISVGFLMFSGGTDTLHWAVMGSSKYSRNIVGNIYKPDKLFKQVLKFY